MSTNVQASTGISEATNKKIKNYFLFKSFLKQSASQLSAQTGMFSEIPGNSVKSLDWKVSPYRSSVFASCHVAYSITQMKLSSTFQHFNKDFFTISYLDKVINFLNLLCWWWRRANTKSFVLNLKENVIFTLWERNSHDHILSCFFLSPGFGLSWSIRLLGNILKENRGNGCGT